MKKFFTQMVCIAFITMPCVWSLNAQNHNIILSPTPVMGGVVAGSGVYEYGMPVLVTAIPQPFYIFERWEEDGEVVTLHSEYHFTVTKDRHLVAIFV